jgi:hypothetical protein
MLSRQSPSLLLALRVAEMYQSLQRRELVEVLLDEQLAHGCGSLSRSHMARGESIAMALTFPAARTL